VGGFFLLKYASQWSSHLQRLCGLVADGRLAVVLDSHRFVGLASVPDAVDLLQSGTSTGKIVVQLSEALPAAGACAKL
jgi:NADPH-dependent curcumin reductase CurA